MLTLDPNQKAKLDTDIDAAHGAPKARVRRHGEILTSYRANFPPNLWDTALMQPGGASKYIRDLAAADLPKMPDGSYGRSRLRYGPKRYTRLLTVTLVFPDELWAACKLQRGGASEYLRALAEADLVAKGLYHEDDDTGMKDD